ncbi:MAG: CDGSH iron-sulfur domain-containing protein [Planctomycetes bacterium]|nr:CDGSH iron-sulfur domain-containing protein [Planctomycetota bacterium]
MRVHTSSPTPKATHCQPRRTSPQALCRCGHSANKPFCDGAHRDCGFRIGSPSR